MEPQNDIAARVIALVADTTGMPADTGDCLAELCDDRRENIVALLNAFEDEFHVDMSGYSFEAAFPRLASPVSALEAVVVLFLGPAALLTLLRAIIDRDYWTYGPIATGLAITVIWIVGAFASAILANRISEWWSPQRRTNTVTVQTLIDAARAKRWTHPVEKVVA